jgi:hypothetical protein
LKDFSDVDHNNNNLTLHQQMNAMKKIALNLTTSTEASCVIFLNVQNSWQKIKSSHKSVKNIAVLLLLVKNRKNSDLALMQIFQANLLKQKIK